MGKICRSEMNETSIVMTARQLIEAHYDPAYVSTGADRAIPVLDRLALADLSPASILATRDWLDPNPSASAVCVNPHRSRSSRTPFANDSFSATNRVANRPARPREPFLNQPFHRNQTNPLYPRTPPTIR